MLAVNDRPNAIDRLPTAPAAMAPTHQPACIPFMSGRRAACSTAEPWAFMATSTVPKAMPNRVTATSRVGRSGAKATPSRLSAVRGPPYRNTVLLPARAMMPRMACMVTSAPRPQASRIRPTVDSVMASLSVSAGMRTVIVPTIRPARTKVRTAP